MQVSAAGGLVDRLSGSVSLQAVVLPGALSVSLCACACACACASPLDGRMIDRYSLRDASVSQLVHHRRLLNCLHRLRLPSVPRSSLPALRMVASVACVRTLCWASYFKTRTRSRATRDHRRRQGWCWVCTFVLVGHLLRNATFVYGLCVSKHAAIVDRC